MTDSTSLRTRLSRREAIAWVLAAAATLSARLPAGPKPAPGATGYGTDPDLLKVYRPGEVWPLTLTETQRRTTVALCDLILPADGEAPPASAVGVPDFIDEWISAPYPAQRADRAPLLEGLDWIDGEARRRHGRAFADLTLAEQSAFADALCSVTRAAPADRAGAQFFRRFRDLVMGGYYTTPEGMKDIGYVGNVPLPHFEGPPPEVLRALGLD
ncbi:MAG: gluconate 2-dehydrogenase subunit 3 family protein [Opitutaceae bacterium]|nr:gluconate 2-dehydrogenase subunit 3 family protein [Opitutaceae bacterium]